MAVVGGGLAGLSAALDLKDAGVRVELFERSRLLGGRATSFEIDGIEVDNGQHVFLACCTEFVRFAQRVGMEDNLRLQERFDARILGRDGREGRLCAGSLPAPLHLTGSFLTYPHLSISGKLKIARALAAVILSEAPNNAIPSEAPNNVILSEGPNNVILSEAPNNVILSEGAERRSRRTEEGEVLSGGAKRRSRRTNEPNETNETNQTNEPETFEEWLVRHGQGPAERRAFWDPFFIPALNAPYDRVEAAEATFVLRTAFLNDAKAARFGFSRVPLAHLAQAAAGRLDAVHLSTAVTSLELDEANDRVTLGLSKGDANPTFDAVVLAVPPRQVAKLLGDPARYDVHGLDAYEPYPIVDVHLWHDAGTIGLDFAAALDSPLQWIFEKAPGYLCCSFSAAQEYLTLPTAELEALAWREAQAFIPTLKNASLTRSAVTRNPEATWLPRVGTKRTAQAAKHPAIAIAGSWTDTGWADTMESAVRSGAAAAKHLLDARTEVKAPPETLAPTQPQPDAERRKAQALHRATGWLLQNQSTEGWWSGELETNVTMTAEHVLLFRFLGLPLDEFRTGATAHILQHQRSDGSWALYYDGPADLSTTIESYVALKVLGMDPQRSEMRKALQVILREGGVVNARVFTKIWLALFGIYPWSGVPSLPPELVFFPLWMPFNLYDFACWARGTVAPLTIVVSKKPVRPLGMDVGEIIAPGTEDEMKKVRGKRHWLMLVERLQKLYERLPHQPKREEAQRRVAEWIVERQEADGSWGGIQPPWVYSLIALDLMGYDLNHPVMRKGIDGMRRFSLDDHDGWRFLACMSPVWDTAWAVRALAVAGFDSSHPAMRRAVEWMLREQIPDDAPGDWRMKCDETHGNGWAFEFDNDAYPDIDDTTIVVLSLLEGGEPDAVASAVERGRRWTLAMDCRNGAWAAFDRDNTRELLYDMPFSDFGAMIDPPTEDVTAHVLEMLAALGYDTSNRYVARGLEYLRKTQRPSGAWWGRWGVNFVYGTWCVISALAALRTGRDMVEKGAAWLVSVQNPDGGWGETCHSYVDESFAGIGHSTASQTAWAVNALQLAGLAQHSATQRGLSYLCERQRPDGTWDEPECTGTGFPRDFYINYHLYRHLFPTMALGVDAKMNAPRHPERSASCHPERSRGAAESKDVFQPSLLSEAPAESKEADSEPAMKEPTTQS